MKRFRFSVLTFSAALFLVGLSLAVPGAVWADDKPKEGAKPATAAAKPVTAPAGMPSQEEMMKAWMAAATPGEAHKKLEPVIGSFTANTKMWMDPT
ncbi:MAG: hypothetical protein ACXWE1_04455, partial [Thermoanaerobaculia bacterium]